VVEHYDNLVDNGGRFDIPFQHTVKFIAETVSYVQVAK
jgi:hypothetical protein